MDWSDQAERCDQRESHWEEGGGSCHTFSYFEISLTNSVLLKLKWLLSDSYRCVLSCDSSSDWLLLAGCAGKTLFILISRQHKIVCVCVCVCGSDKCHGITNHSLIIPYIPSIYSVSFLCLFVLLVPCPRGGMHSWSTCVALLYNRHILISRRFYICICL